MYWIFVIGVAVLPVVGLVAGPAYAPIIFGLGGAQLLYAAVAHRRLPRFDPTLVAIAFAFCALCWASILWSIVPDHSLHGAVQMTSILVGALVFLSIRGLPDDLSEAVFRVLPYALMAAIALLCVDTALGYKLQLLITHGAGNAPTKYNRGLEYSVLLAWPVFANLLWQRRRFLAAGFAAVVILGAAVGLSSTAKVQVVLGAAVIVLAILLRRRAAAVFSAAISAMALLLPFFLRLVEPYRTLVEPYVKHSGDHRLEIWDYMSARVVERPFLGWGLWSTKSVPITPQEMSHYIYVSKLGIYPHNQWLELWVETGLLGALIGAILAVVVLRRIRRTLPADLQPYAYAAVASAVAISSFGFEVTTDSWWAALAATGFLFRELGRRCANAAAAS